MALESGSVWNMKCATFAPVSGSMKWSDVKVNEIFLPCSDTVMTLTAGGATELYLTYVDEGTAADCAEFGLTAGWWDYDTINEWDWESQLDPSKCFTEGACEAGLGFIVNAGDDGATITVPSPLAD